VAATIRPVTAAKENPQALREPPLTDEGLVRRHLRFGWWSVAIFGGAGLVLETLHGFKLGLYVDVSNDTRRLMWTLSHAHGTLLGLVHVAFAATIRLANLPAARLHTASAALRWSSLLLAGGFFLGGIQFYAGDPGWGIVAVPVGAALLVYAAAAVARLLTTDGAASR